MIKIGDKLYNKDLIRNIEKNDYVPKYMTMVETYDIKINYIDDKTEYIEFETEQERDEVFNNVYIT